MRDEDVNSPEPLGRGLGHASKRRGLRNVRLDRHRLGANRLELAERACRLPDVASDHRNARSGPRATARHFEPDTPRLEMDPENWTVR